MDDITFSLRAVLVFVCVFASVIAVPPFPEWPEVYKTCVNVETPREFIKAGWYVDAENRRMRLDSYGIPEGLNESTARQLQYLLNEMEDFDYACSQFGPPLYEFIYHYDVGKMYSLWPSPSPPYRTCSVTNIFNKFPNSPLMPELEYVEEAKDNITMYYHWRSEFFLFTMDYYFHVANGLPYRLFVNAEEHTFISFSVDDLDNDTFIPPRGVSCNMGQ